MDESYLRKLELETSAGPISGAGGVSTPVPPVGNSPSGHSGPESGNIATLTAPADAALIEAAPEGNQATKMSECHPFVRMSPALAGDILTNG